MGSKNGFFAKGSSSLRFGFLLLLGCTVMEAQAAKFTDETEKDFPLRSVGRLQLTNVKGDVSVQGWALDKIRVKITKEAFADTPEKARGFFDSLDYRAISTDGGIEVTSGYGKNLSIEERVQQKASPKVRLDIAVYAPPYLHLKIWSVGGRVLIKNWNAVADVRANDGSIQIENINAEKLSIQCLTCNSDLREIHSSLRYLGGAGQVKIDHLRGKSVYVETDGGSQTLAYIQGDQLYVSKKGPIEGSYLKGKVEFRSQDASVRLQEISGSLSGTADSGSVSARIRDWEPLDQTLIETIRGNISLTFPEGLSAEADVWSVGGATVLGYPLVRSQDVPALGPEPINHFVGRIGDGGELLRVFSEHGDVAVIKGKS